MEFQKVLETRRTVRKYSAGVTREQMEELLRAAQEAPSWKNSQTGTIDAGGVSQSLCKPSN